MTGQEWVEGAGRGPATTVPHQVFPPVPTCKRVDFLSKGWATGSGPEKDGYFSRRNRAAVTHSQMQNMKRGSHTAPSSSHR